SDLPGKRADLAVLSAPEPSHLIAIGVVVLLKFLAKLAKRIAARPRVPRLCNKDTLAENRIILDLLQHHGVRIEARIATQYGRKIEAEAGNAHLFDPIPKAVDYQP